MLSLMFSSRSRSRRARFGATLVALIALTSCGGGGAEPQSPPVGVTLEPDAEQPEASEPEQSRKEVSPGEEQSLGVKEAEEGAHADASETSAEPPPLPEGTTVLHIGDSFAGALGIDLNREFKKVGVRGILKYETSTYIPTWAWGKELDKYLWQFKPDLVLITLGANELEIPDPRARIRTIKKLISRLGERPCVWIGIPLWEDARPDLMEVIRENVEPCVYMDSAKLLPDMERAGDDIHPSMSARKNWAKFVLDWLKNQRDPNSDQPWALKR